MENFLTQNFDNFISWWVTFIPALLKGIVISVFGWFLAKWLKTYVDKAAARLKWDEIVWNYVSTLLR